MMSSNSTLLLQATAVASGAGTCTASATASAFAEAIGNQCTASAVASAAASCLVSTSFSVATASAFAKVSQVPWDAIGRCLTHLAPCGVYHIHLCWAKCSAACCDAKWCLCNCSRMHPPERLQTQREVALACALDLLPGLPW